MGSTSEYTRQWRADFKARDPEGYAAYRALEARKYRAKHPEVARAAVAKWAAAHPGERAVALRDWMSKHPGYGEAWRLANLQKWIFKAAKCRAKQQGLPFDIAPEDIEIPEFCPALGIRLDSTAKRGQPNALSLDRIRPPLGYVKGNVRVLSTRANAIKRDASAEELEAIAAYIRRETE